MWQRTGQMGKTDEIGKLSEQPEGGRVFLLGSSDQEVVSLCIKGRQEAWEEFYTRFAPDIRRAIEHTLFFSSDLDSFDWKFEESVWDINENIVRKFCEDGFLSKCVDPSGIRQWLKTVATNQARDWLKERGRLKNLPKQQTEEGMRSLEEPLYEDSEITLGETISDETDVDRALRRYLASVLDEIDRLDNKRDFWIVRLSLVAALPLTREEAGDLATFSPLAAETVRETLERIISSAEERDAKRAADLGRGVLLWHQLRRLESELRMSLRDTSPEGVRKCEELRGNIDRKQKRRELMLAAGKKIPRPSNREIAGLVGIPDEQYVTTILRRVRDAIGKKRGEHFPGRRA